ncbi:MAG: thiol reductant ABC exporter subunit CydC [Enterococcaceae bacterium]|jgi:thiol reductant ABC exporter CydC subunit|nr:thiol reductant ABC exporter subunit CydC [Enterococcaceae bacterium]MCI1919574.1 thiol reductant ABC exporter subunit CydC [Enterococcaceae bacterium]
MYKKGLIPWLLKMAEPLRGTMALAVLLGTISNLAIVAIPVVGIDAALALFAGREVPTTKILLLLLGLGILRSVARYAEQYCNHDIAFRLLALIRQKMFEQLRKLGPARLTGVKSGEFITGITTDVEALEVFFAHTISPVLIYSLTTVIFTIFLGIHSWLYAVILLAALLLVGVWIPLSSYRRYETVAASQHQAVVGLSQSVMEDIQSLTTIRQFGMEKERIQQLRKEGEANNHYMREKLHQETQLRNLGEAVMLLAVLLMTACGILFHFTGTLIAFGVILTLSAFGPAFALANLANALLTTFSSGGRLYQIFQEAPPLTFPPADADQETAATVEDVTLQHAAFSYPQQPLVFANIDLEIKQGETVGIGGPSGSGKSTLIKLLMRYWDPTSGVIKLNGTPLDEFSKHGLRHLEGFFQQRTFLFDDTIENNIKIGKRTATHEEVEAAAKKAALHEWIMTLPAGYQTKMSPITRQVSDGQKQRIGLARLFLKDASLLLLDEPTSSLDYLNEMAILKNIQELQKEKTVVIVSHRPTTLSIAKRRYVLKDQRLLKE